MPRKRIVKTIQRKHPNNPNLTIEKEVVRKVSTKPPKQPALTQNQKTRQFLEKAGLHQTKSQRRAMEQGMEHVLGYRPAKLSDVVKNPSRHTVTARQPLYDVRKEFRPGEHKLIGYRENQWGEIVPKYEFVPGKEAVTEKKLVGERLVVKKLSKKGQRGKAGKRGKRPGREKKKKKKK